jgi:translation initiation factor 4A
MTALPDNDASFDSLGLKDYIQRGIYSYGFEKPSSIQARAIPLIMEGHDVVAQSQSGTGKTATFVISILEKIDPTVRDCQALIMAPTRELALQIEKVTKSLSKYMEIEVMACIGGTSVRDDNSRLRKGVHIVIGTPGRVYDMIWHRKTLSTTELRVVCLDEADEMLSKGFCEQIELIFNELPQEAQVLLMSATLSPEILDITKRFMDNPKQILLKNDELTLEGIKQFYINVIKDQWKLDTLCDLYSTFTITQCIIYCSRKKIVDWLSDTMMKRDFTVSCLHSDMNHQERQEILQEFRTGQSRVLITTDVLSRGIDIQQVSLVINYDLPTNKETYIHRIGRSGRYGRKGVAINFVTEQDARMLKDIESYYQTQIDEMPENVVDYI